MLGTVIGFVSFVGYLPDVLIPLLTSYIFNLYNDGLQAYVVYFSMTAVIGIIGVGFTLYFKKITKK